MNRRDALAGCAALAALVHPGARGGPVSEAPCGIAWGEHWLAVLHPGEVPRLHTLDDPLAADPALTTDAAWTLTTAGRLQRWPWAASPGPGDTRLHVPAPHALAASADGRVVALAQADALVLLDAAAPPDAPPLKVYAGTDVERRRRARAAALRALPSRRGLLATWPALGEWWEVALDPAAPPFYEGLVHDHRLGEGIATPGYLGVRRLPLGTATPALDHVGDSQPWVAGRDGDDVVVVHLDVRREIARWRLPGARPQGACLLDDGRGLRWWLPHGDGIVEIDPRRWTIVARHPAPGPAVSLQAMGRAGMSDPRLWGLFESGPLRRLASRRDGAWRWVDEAPRDPIACAVDAGRRRLLVAARDPETAASLDDAGRVSDTWPLPATDPVRGLAVPPRKPAAQPL